MRTRRPKTRKNITPAQFRNFIFQGRAVFTLENADTGNYLTYKIRQIKKSGKVVPNQFKVECKSLGDKEYGYQFLGFLDIAKVTFRPWGRTSRDHIGYKTLYWMLRNLEVLENYTNLSIYHEGACCKCGMPLTTPESIDQGIGPICMDRMLGGSAQIMKDLGTWDDLLSYEENVKKALKVDPTLWSKIHVPDHIKASDDHKGTRVLGRLGIL